LIGTHPSYAALPIELRFHTDHGGLIDVLASRTPMSVFISRMQGEFYFRETLGGPRGLHLITDERALSDALDEFRRAFLINRFSAARGLILAIAQPFAYREGKRAWVETTPYNIEAAPILHRLFPEMKMVHTVRDGRDVAASVVRMWWGPENHVDGLHWWSESLRAAELAASSLPPTAVHVLQFDELVSLDRTRSHVNLCNYLEIDPPDVARFFDDEMTEEAAHVGRWKTDLPHEESTMLNDLYREIWLGLRDDGITCRPRPPRVHFR
jgi:hypothetical protein